MHTTKPLIIFGASAFARLMHFYFTYDSAYDIAGFAVHAQFIKAPRFLELPLIALEQIEHNYPPTEYVMFVALGYKQMRARKTIYETVQAKGYELVNYVSSKAILYRGLELGHNNVLMGNVHIEPFVKIGNNNILWSDVLICHDVEIGSHNFLAAKAQIGGFAKIGDLSFLGFDATVLQHVQIADESLLGAKSLLLHDTVPCSKYLGIPAHKVGEHHQDGIMLSD